MPELDLLAELQSYLVTQGIGVRPSAPVPASSASIWTYPRDGAALPRNVTKVNGAYVGETTVTLIDTNLSGPSELEAWMAEIFVDIIVRSPNAGTGKLVQRAIKGLLVPFDAHGGRKQWLMHDLLVENSIEWRGDQPLPQRQAVSEGDAHLTYDRVASYRFSVRRKILAGLTLP